MLPCYSGIFGAICRTFGTLEWCVLDFAAAAAFCIFTFHPFSGPWSDPCNRKPYQHDSFWAHDREKHMANMFQRPVVVVGPLLFWKSKCTTQSSTMDHGCCWKWLTMKNRFLIIDLIFWGKSYSAMMLPSSSYHLRQDFGASALQLEDGLLKFNSLLIASAPSLQAPLVVVLKVWHMLYLSRAISREVHLDLGHHDIHLKGGFDYPFSPNGNEFHRFLGYRCLTICLYHLLALLKLGEEHLGQYVQSIVFVWFGVCVHIHYT